MIKKIQLLFIIIFLVVTSSHAQQDPQYTHYMYNPNVINPAFTGYRNSLTAVLLHRSQWIGMAGAPTSQTFSISSPLTNEKVALGLNITNDVIGPASEIGANVDFSYTLMTEASNISFGIKAGAQRLSFDPTKLSVQDITDTDFSTKTNQISPQVGIGAMLEKENLYLGFSILNLIETDHKNITENTLYKPNQRRSYYGTIGYLFTLSDKVDLKTTLLSKAVFGAPLQLDATANFIINDKATIGAAYRLDAAVSALFGYQISESFLIGAAYDYDMSPLTKFNSGSAELILRYDILSLQSSRKILNPRIF